MEHRYFHLIAVVHFTAYREQCWSEAYMAVIANFREAERAS